MSAAPAILLGTLALATAAAVFQLKHAVRERERELALTRQAIAEERARIRTLRADIAWLARVERIGAHARELGLEPMRTERMIRIGDLPDALQLELAGRTLLVELQDGVAIELRFKPLPAPPSLGSPRP
ncbi:MAG: hypothetical protein N2038_02135 [Geminicoccaceae bacterium]|nr:hypothetical protein [Geminicoccaceae bacterium]MCS7268565.1 hypothetical protein [Geminicoccaceae bacterium]MCX7629028.1 hypothetical protein [Geminicoccaceae bacterium]MDW8123849.1 hypothetical protein [Geminicoccaceae bacterium]MDW8341173.1 hypothetical protein [Geminicoccaceae bacterium]